MISSTGGFSWGGVLCWDGVSGCRVCGGVDKDWGVVYGELGDIGCYLGGELCEGGIGWDLGGSRELNWVGGGSCLWSGVGGEFGGVGWSRVGGVGGSRMGWVGWSRVGWVGWSRVGGVGWSRVGGVGGSRVGGVGGSRVGWVGWSRVGGVGGSRVLGGVDRSR